MEKGVGGKTWLYRSTTGKAEGPYANVTKSFFVKGIDGFPFEDDDGLYFLWGGGNIGKLNAARSGFEGPVRQLVDADGDHVGYEGNGLIKANGRSEEHTSELQSLMRISYAVFCLKKKKKKRQNLN